MAKSGAYRAVHNHVRAAAISDRDTICLDRTEASVLGGCRAVGRAPLDEVARNFETVERKCRSRRAGLISRPSRSTTVTRRGRGSPRRQEAAVGLPIECKAQLLDRIGLRPEDRGEVGTIALDDLDRLL